MLMANRVVDDAGKDMGPEEVGELLVKGPIVTKGYHNNPAANKEAFVDGWFKTGDVGYVRNNLVYIVDRKKVRILFRVGTVAANLCPGAHKI